MLICSDSQCCLVSCNSDSHNKSARVRGGGALSKSGNARQDLVRVLAPHEGLGLFVADVDELPDGALELAHTAGRAAPNLFGGQFSEPPFDEVQPRAVRRREVDVDRGRLANQVRMSGVLWVP